MDIAENSCRDARLYYEREAIRYEGSALPKRYSMVVRFTRTSDIA